MRPHAGRRNASCALFVVGCDRAIGNVRLAVPVDRSAESVTEKLEHQSLGRLIEREHDRREG